MTNIPSDEEFAQASRLASERSRNLDAVRRNVVQQFSEICPLFEFWILDQRDVDFRAYVFFKTDKDIEKCKNNGTCQEIIDFIYDELDRAGRGKKGQICVAFEFDSDENVNATYGGDYFLRLR